MAVQSATEFVTTSRAAELLGSSMRYVRDLVKAGTLPSSRVESCHGRVWGTLIRRRDVETLIVKRVTKHLQRAS